MADVFISYTREDRDIAAGIARLLSETGVSVFIDEKSIKPGASFPKVIDRELKSARAVIALWSPLSLSRPWVTQECTVGKEVSVLIPLVIKPLNRHKDVPVNLYDTQTIDFEDFRGTRDHPSWPRLIEALADTLNRPELVEADAKLPPAPANTTTTRPIRRRATWLLVAIVSGVVAVVGLGTAVYIFRNTLTPPPATAASAAEPQFDDEASFPAPAAGPIIPPFNNNLPATQLPVVFKDASPVTAELLICGERDASNCTVKPAEPDGHVIFYDGTVIRFRVTSPVAGHLILLAHMPNGVIEVVSPRQDVKNGPPEGQPLAAGNAEPVPALEKIAIHASLEDAAAASEVGEWIFIVIPQLEVLPFNVNTLVRQYLYNDKTYRTDLAGLDRFLQHIKPDALRYSAKWGYGTLTYQMDKP